MIVLIMDGLADDGVGDDGGGGGSFLVCFCWCGGFGCLRLILIFLCRISSYLAGFGLNCMERKEWK